MQGSEIKHRETTNVILVCFAVKPEAKAFVKFAGERRNVHVLLTGMGRTNAMRAVHGFLDECRPVLILSCGFAGGLNPELTSGSVVFAGDGRAGQEEAFIAAGARKVKFHCADHVATTAEEKHALFESSGADAVEMESGVVATLCREANIPFATLRVILDTADRDLPLDFNLLMTSDWRLNYWKLALALLARPWKIFGLMNLETQSDRAAAALAKVLSTVIPD